MLYSTIITTDVPHSKLCTIASGFIMVYKGKRSTYLPQVWEYIPDPIELLSPLCLKQGSAVNCRQDNQTVVYRYGALEFGEQQKGF